MDINCKCFGTNFNFFFLHNRQLCFGSYWSGHFKKATAESIGFYAGHWTTSSSTIVVSCKGTTQPSQTNATRAPWSLNAKIYNWKRSQFTLELRIHSYPLAASKPSEVKDELKNYFRWLRWIKSIIIHRVI